MRCATPFPEKARVLESTKKHINVFVLVLLSKEHITHTDKLLYRHLASSSLIKRVVASRSWSRPRLLLDEKKKTGRGTMVTTENRVVIVTASVCQFSSARCLNKKSRKAFPLFLFFFLFTLLLSFHLFASTARSNSREHTHPSSTTAK
jgi:hypothetical protein